MIKSKPKSRLESIKLSEMAYNTTACQTTYHELFQGLFKEFIVNAHTARMFHGGQWILDHVFDIKINVDLLQRNSHAWTFEIGKHDEFDIGRGLVVVQLVLVGTEGDKTGDKDMTGQ